MNCTDARFALAANPGDDDVALAAHLDGCPTCAEYAGEMRELDRRVLKALQVGVPAAPAQQPRHDRRRAFQAPIFALAASVAGVAVLAALLWTAFPRESLADAVVGHMSHEPQAWSSTAPIPGSAIAYTLARSGVRLEGDVSDVTYANTCWFRGRGVPHLVVRSASGPVTVMVLPNEPVSRRVAFDEGGYRGVLVPAARGSVAVLARGAGHGAAAPDTPGAAELDAIAARAIEVIRYVD
jgi:hypothetical protein